MIYIKGGIELFLTLLRKTKVHFTKCTFFNFQICTFLTIYLYQKDERALLGILRAVNFLPSNKESLSLSLFCFTPIYSI